MAYLVTILILAESFLRRFSTRKLIVLTAIILTFPVISSQIPQQKMIYITLISLFWAGYRIFESKIIGKISFLICLLVLIFSVLAANSVISADLHFDFERTFIADNDYPKTIARFQTTSVYLPYRLRSVLFNSWIIPVSLIGRGFLLFWFDQILPAIGLIALMPLAISLYRRPKLHTLGPIFIAATTAGLSRNPDTSGLYLLCLPFLITIISDSLSFKIKK